MHRIDKTLFVILKLYQVFNENYLEYLQGALSPEILVPSSLVCSR